MKDEMAEIRPGQAEARPMTTSLIATIAIIAGIVAGLAVGAGLRDKGPRPLASGVTRSPFTAWQKPISTSGSNEGNNVEPGSKVDVFEGCLVVTKRNGDRLVIPSGYHGPIVLGP